MKRKIIILLFGAALAGQVPAAGQATAAVAEEIAWYQKIFGWENGANWTENLYNVSESLLNMDQQLQEAIKGNRYLELAYGVGTLVTEDPIVPELYNEIYMYYNTVQAVRGSIQSNLLSGSITPQKASSVLASLIYPETLIKEDIAWIGTIIGRPGETWKEKAEALKELSTKLNNHRRLTELIYNATIKKAQADSTKQATANKVRAATGLAQVQSSSSSAGATPGGNTSSSPASATSGGSSKGSDTDDIVKEAKRIGEARQKITLRETKEAIGKARKPALDIASVIIGIMASIAIAFAYSKRHRGEHQSADALYKVFAGLVFAIISLQIVQTVIMNIVK